MLHNIFFPQSVHSPTYFGSFGSQDANEVCEITVQSSPTVHQRCPKSDPRCGQMLTEEMLIVMILTGQILTGPAFLLKCMNGGPPNNTFASWRQQTVLHLC